MKKNISMIQLERVLLEATKRLDIEMFKEMCANSSMYKKSIVKPIAGSFERA